MPCPGAQYPDADEVNQVTDRVLEVLKTEFGIFPDCSIRPGGEHELDRLLAAHFDEMTGVQRSQVIDQLKEAIAEILFQHNCEQF